MQRCSMRSGSNCFVIQRQGVKNASSKWQVQVHCILADSSAVALSMSRGFRRLGRASGVG